MENNKDFELTEEEQEFLHMMYEETFDFNQWADDFDEALKNAEIEEVLKATKPEVEILTIIIFSMLKPQRPLGLCCVILLFLLHISGLMFQSFPIQKLLHLHSLW